MENKLLAKDVRKIAKLLATQGTPFQDKEEYVICLNKEEMIAFLKRNFPKWYKRWKIEE